MKANTHVWSVGVGRKQKRKSLIRRKYSIVKRFLQRDLHKRFNNQRVNGEWFELSTEDVDYIKSLVTHK